MKNVTNVRVEPPRVQIKGEGGLHGFAVFLAPDADYPIVVRRLADALAART